MSPQAAPATWFCSFCLKSQHEVKKLVAGPGFIAICDECVEMSRIYMEGGTPDLSQQLPQEKLPTERLLKSLQAIDDVMRGKDSQLSAVVGILRARKVSWAQIGEALGVSRQSAWERFAASLPPDD